MKKILLSFTLAILTCLNVSAQEGAILYTEYNPDWCLESIQYHYPPDSILLDFDNDDKNDFAITIFYQREIIIKQHPLNGWEWRTKLSSFVADSLVSSAPLPSPPSGWKTYSLPVKNTMMVGVRKVVNDSTIYYGWFNEIWIDSTILGINNGGTPRIKEYVCVHDMAFCTIPNYPLRWGQTSLTSIEENNEASFASLHPNPTNGQVTITGENLRQAEVFNTIGQKVLNTKGEGNELRIDMAALPAGVYLVTVTDEEGRRCVRKVVKE